MFEMRSMSFDDLKPGQTMATDCKLAKTNQETKTENKSCVANESSLDCSH